MEERMDISDGGSPEALDAKSIGSSAKTSESLTYSFSWDVIGYDSYPTTICSSTFTTEKEFSQWKVEMGMMRVDNVNRRLPCCLRRLGGIGPESVTVHIKVVIEIADQDKQEEEGTFTFCEKSSNTWSFYVDLPVEQSGDKWLTSKRIQFKLDLKPVPKNRDVSGVEMEILGEDEDLTSLSDDLAKLLTSQSFPYHFDTSVMIGSNDFKLHKSILFARWPYFFSKFKVQKWDPTILCMWKRNQILMKEEDAEELAKIPRPIFDQILHFVYTGKFVNERSIGMDGWVQIYNLIDKYNIYRLNEKLNKASSKYSCKYLLQSFRAPFEFLLRDIKSGKCVGDFVTCEVKLKCDEDKESIKSIEARCYVRKGPLNYNWLYFSLLLGRIPPKNPVTVRCKLYAIEDSKAQEILLTEQNFIFDQSCQISFEKAYFKSGSSKTSPPEDRKLSHRYIKYSDPVVTWQELTDPGMDFLTSARESSDEKNCMRLRLDLKVFDGESACDSEAGPIELCEVSGVKELGEDLGVLLDEGTYSDIFVQAESKVMKLHRGILIARSKGLRNIIVRKTNIPSILLEIKEHLLEPLMRYIYTGKIYNLSKKYVPELLEVAEKLEVTALCNLLNKQ